MAEADEYEYSEWSEVDLPGETNHYLGKPLPELIAAQQNFLAALKGLKPSQTDKAQAISHALSLVEGAIAPRNN